MSKLLPDELNAKFFKSIKSQYPHLSFNQVKSIVDGPWEYLKQVMKEGTLCDVRLKYFGVFTVYPGRAEGVLRDMKKTLDKGLVGEEYYIHTEEKVKNFLEKHEKN